MLHCLRSRNHHYQLAAKTIPFHIPTTMRTVAFVLTCLACVGHARRMQASSGPQQSVRNGESSLAKASVEPSRSHRADAMHAQSDFESRRVCFPDALAAAAKLLAVLHPAAGAQISGVMHRYDAAGPSPATSRQRGVSPEVLLRGEAELGPDRRDDARSRRYVDCRIDKRMGHFIQSKVKDITDLITKSWSGLKACHRWIGNHRRQVQFMWTWALSSSVSYQAATINFMRVLAARWLFDGLLEAVMGLTGDRPLSLNEKFQSLVQAKMDSHVHTWASFISWAFACTSVWRIPEYELNELVFQLVFPPGKDSEILIGDAAKKEDTEQRPVLRKVIRYLESVRGELIFQSSLSIIKKNHAWSGHPEELKALDAQIDRLENVMAKAVKSSRKTKFQEYEEKFWQQLEKR